MSAPLSIPPGFKACIDAMLAAETYEATDRVIASAVYYLLGWNQPRDTLELLQLLVEARKQRFNELYPDAPRD